MYTHRHTKSPLHLNYSVPHFLTDRSSRIVGFCRLIDGESHRYLPNVLCEDLADCFVHVPLFPQCECCFPLGHVEIDVFGHMHSDGGAHYFIYGFPLGCDRSRFFTMANGCDLSSDDQHILHHLFPQVKVFAVKFFNFNSYFKR